MTEQHYFAPERPETGKKFALEKWRITVNRLAMFKTSRQLGSSYDTGKGFWDSLERQAINQSLYGDGGGVGHFIFCKIFFFRFKTLQDFFFCHPISSLFILERSINYLMLCVFAVVHFFSPQDIFFGSRRCRIFFSAIRWQSLFAFLFCMIFFSGLKMCSNT